MVGWLFRLLCRSVAAVEDRLVVFDESYFHWHIVVTTVVRAIPVGVVVCQCGGGLDAEKNDMDVYVHVGVADVEPFRPFKKGGIPERTEQYRVVEAAYQEEVFRRYWR